MQKMGASYVAKRIADQLMAPPAKRAEPSEPAGGPDGEVFHDEDGQPLGMAYRVPGVAVYVVSDGYDSPQAELERCLAEPESRLFFHTEDGRITGLVYVPDPSRAPRRVEAFRADDV